MRISKPLPIEATQAIRRICKASSIGSTSRTQKFSDCGKSWPDEVLRNSLPEALPDGSAAPVG